MKTKSLSILICLFMILSVFPIIGTATSNAKLRSIYQDNMLFRQNEISSVAGVATPGSKIEIIFSCGDIEIIHEENTVSPDGTFSVDFAAPAGSFNTYKLTVKENGKTFSELNGILFGELWLASGQSNMQYGMGDSQMCKNGETGDSNLRILYVEPISYYNGGYESTPATPQEENYNCSWICADSKDMYSCSAVAYYFGAKLAQKLDVPVGIISCSLGGSTLTSWLSRDIIDSDLYVKESLTKSKEYINANDWDESKANQITDMTANFNTKIYPLRHLNVSGFIWYQGESDIFYKHTPELYGRMFTLLQDLFTDNFRYNNGKMPVIFTQLANYWYGDSVDLFEDYAFYFEKMQAEYSDSRALITIYDVSLDYTDLAGAIHPMTKQPVGERMAECANRLVYDKSDAYTAATIQSAVADNGSIIVSFKNVGDGLVCNGAKLNGFSICGADGIYVDADAEIIGKNSVRISSRYVSEPISASYAYVLDNTTCNLYSSENGMPFMPVGAFITDENYRDNLFEGMFLTNTTDKQIWHTTGSAPGLYDVWTSSNSEISYTDDSLNIKSNEKNPEINYNIGIKNNRKTEYFNDVNLDFSDYSIIAVDITNNGDCEIEGIEIVFNTSTVTYYSAFCNEMIPADGETHTVEIEIDKLKFDGNRGGISYGNEKIKEITGISFIFENEGNADFSISDISFAPDTENYGLRMPEQVERNGNLFEYFCSVVLVVFKNIFGGLFGLFGANC